MWGGAETFIIRSKEYGQHGCVWRSFITHGLREILGCLQRSGYTLQTDDVVIAGPTRNVVGKRKVGTLVHAAHWKALSASISDVLGMCPCLLSPKRMHLGARPIRAATLMKFSWCVSSRRTAWSFLSLKLLDHVQSPPKNLQAYDVVVTSTVMVETAVDRAAVFFA